MLRVLLEDFLLFFSFFDFFSFLRFFESSRARVGDPPSARNLLTNSPLPNIMPDGAAARGARGRSREDARARGD